MESSTSTVGSGRRAVDEPTIAKAFRLTAEQRGDEVAARTVDDAVSLTWNELRDRSDALAGGLAGLGLEKGQCAAILLTNRPEFHLVDLAIMTVGGTPFSIYPTYAPGQIAYVVSDADARILITEPAFLDNVLAARAELPNLEHVIVLDTGGDVPAGCLALEDVEGSNPAFDVAASVAALQPDDVLTLIYTSGTTGPPKGVQLTHRNLLAAVAGVEQIVQFPEGSRVISWLPAAHIAERAAHHYLPLVFGFQITTCPVAREVVAYLPQVHPQWFFAVPRIWEKLKAGLEAMIAGKPDGEREVAERFLADALEKVRLEQRGEAVPADLAARVAVADEQLFAGVRTMLGLDQVVAINVGAAPTPKAVLEFFHAIGLPLAELWGMSETCGAGTVNPPDRIKIGTVGPASAGTELTIAEDGEVLVRGDIVMLGYRNKPEQTADAIDADGWLHTGDIGTLDEDGYLTIVDRKKEIIINAAGKNMSPANIEAIVKTSSPLIGQACVIGDARSYNTALIVLDSDFAPAWAAQHDRTDTSLETLSLDVGIRAEVQAGVDRANAELARVEQIKKFVIVSGDWLPGGDELTPTMKLKRKPIDAKYAATIDGMYAG